MAKRHVTKGSVDVSVYVNIRDYTSVSDGGLTGLVFNAAGLSCYYVRPLGTATQINLVTQTVGGAHTDGGFVEVSAANLPGVYRLDLPDAVCAVGQDSVVVQLRGAANMAENDLELELTVQNLQAASVHGAVTVDPSGGPSIRTNVWVMSPDGAQITAGLTNCTIVLYSQAGAVLASPALVAAPDAQGVFAVTFPDPGLVVGQTATYFVLSVLLNGVTMRNVVGVTFARTV